MEIERKFLLKNDGWRNDVLSSEELKQGYISDEPSRTVRIRISQNKAWLTVKGESKGIKREEFEFEIPKSDAEKMFGIFCRDKSIIKIRHIVMHLNRRWEIDEFKGRLEGIIVAETELESESENIIKPQWLGQEVSHDPKYFNSNLAREAPAK